MRTLSLVLLCVAVLALLVVSCEAIAHSKAKAHSQQQQQWDWPWARKPAPKPAAPKPDPRHPAGSTVAGRVLVTPQTTNVAPSSSIAGDLSPIEEQVDSADAEVPLTFTDATRIQQAENAVKALPIGIGAPKPFSVPMVGSAAPGTAPRLPYDLNFNMPEVLSDGRGGTVPIVGAVPASANGLCGSYAGANVFTMTGNRGVVYQVVKVLPQHLVDPNSAKLAPSASDNTMRTVTACAFDKMRTAAKAAGVDVKISSAFRVLARQQYFKNCQITKKCNKGRLAATPGTSNHGVGIALDLNQASPGVYAWLAKNAVTYGFVRTVPKEKWHWEYRPGTPKARYT